MNTIETPIAANFTTAQEAMTRASNLAGSGQTAAALELYRQLRSAFPHQPDGYLQAAELLTGQSLTQQSFALLCDGQAKFPEDVRFDISLAWLTYHRQDMPAAIARWERLRARLPTHPVGYIGGAMALRDMRRLDEANALLETAIARFPADAAVHVEHAWLAHRSQDGEAALRLWQTIRENFPNHPAGFSGAAATLLKQGRLAEAEALLAAGGESHPQDRGIAVEYARLAQRRKEWDKAATRWLAVRTQFADWPDGFTAGAESLREAGCWQEAEILLSTAERRWPNHLGVATAIAWLAHHRADWKAAAERWTNVRARFPDHQPAYLAGAAALQAAGRHPQALAALAEAEQHWPNAWSVLAAAADLAHARADHAAAAGFGHRIVELFPAQPDGYFHAARALRELRRTADAEALLTDVSEKFANDDNVLSIWASLSMATENWPEAIRRWRILQERFPSEPKFIWQCANALTSSGQHAGAEALLQAATQRFPTDPLIALTLAECLLRRDAAAEADFIAMQLRQRNPNDLAAYGLGIRARRAMQDDAGVSELLHSMLTLFPNDPMALRLWAEDAAEHRDWPAAEARWTRFREHVPSDPAGYVGGASALLEGGFPDGSDALLAQGIELLPHDPRILIEYAHNAMRHRDWKEAILRWERCRRQLPTNPVGYLGGAQVLRDAGQLDRAEALLRQATGLFRDDANVAAEFARIALGRGDAPAMIERSRLHAQRYPDRVQAAVAYAEALSKSGDHPAAEAILLVAQARFPDNLEPFAEYAQVAIRTGAWTTALERWQTAQRRFPHIDAISHRIFEARMRIAEVDPDFAEATSEEGTTARNTPEPEMADIVKDFESLGGAGHGCEFGLFQRAYGAEPLGLLRWADLGADLLMDALEARFEGVGLPENTLVFTPEASDRPEYWTRDTRYWMAMRCFIYADEVPYEKMVVQACRRIQFLQRKLIQDLQTGEKIFVFKSMFRNLTDQELARLHRATRSYGNNTLLYVRYTDADNPNGSVRVAGPGLLIGHVDRFAFSPENQHLGSANDHWAAVCARAHAIWCSGGVPGTTPGGQLGADEAAGSPAVSQAEPAESPGPPPIKPPPPQSALSSGRQLVAGGCLDRPAFALRWSAQKLADVRRARADQPEHSLEHGFASIQLHSLEGDHAAARARIGQLVDDFPTQYPHEDHLFEGLLLSTVISGQWDITPRLLRDRFATDWCAAVDVEAMQPAAQTMRWEIDSAGKSHFHFNSDMFQRDRTWIELLGWSRSLTLYHDYTTSSDAHPGSAIVSLGDCGAAPGLACSEHRAGYFLVPDPVFLITRGYADFHASFDAARVAWHDRSPAALWRGASTGQLRSGWRDLPRLKLCLLGKQLAAPDLLDVGITSFVGLPPAMLREAEAAGLGAPTVKPVDFMRYKYQIDIDGNTNAWAGLFIKLLTGSPVLKVRSPFDYRQWYYDDLIPWHNYVPVEAGMGDLIEKITWLRAHDEAARKIGQAGLALVNAMSPAGELTRARATISAAIRHASGQTEVIISFANDDAETRFLVDGWSGIVTMAAAQGRHALGPESRIRFPRPGSRGDLQLRLTLAAGTEPIDPFHMITVVNGIQVSDTVVASVCQVVATVPAAALARSTQTTVTLLFPDDTPPALAALPAGLNASSVLFTKLELGVP